MGRRVRSAAVQKIHGNWSTMSTLHIFGDSFAEDSTSSWTRLLSSKLGYLLKNYAQGGSCIEYSFLKLTENIYFKDNDIVIFVMSSPNRIVTNKTIYNDPSAASNLTPGGEVQQFLDWNLQNIPQFLIDSKPTLYSSYILNLSIQHPTVKFIIVKAFDFSINGVKKTPNFLVIDHVNLFKLSNAEFKIPHNGQFQEILGKDCRVNHFTNPNLKILALLMFNVIKDWNTAELNTDRFHKGIINMRFKTIDDIYKLFADTGLIERQFIDDRVSLYKNGLVTRSKKPFWRL
jgi:hypothetical protein